MRYFHALAMGAAMLLALVSPGTARGQEPLKLRVGWTEAPSHLVPVVFSHPEVLKHYGKSFTVEPARFRGSAPQITALAAGELDIAMLGFSSFALAIQNAHMEDLRAIGDGHRDGVPGYFSSPYLVRIDGGIGGIADLKGKVLATNGIGGATYMALCVMMRDHGFEEKRDYQIVEVQFPNMIAMLEEKKIDLGPVPPRFAAAAEKLGDLRPLFTVRDAMGETQMTLMAARAPFIAANRAQLVDFFEDFQRGVRWFTDPANRRQVIAILAGLTKEPASSFAEWLYTKKDNYRDPEVRPNLGALQSNLDSMTRSGFLKASIVVKNYSDLSLVDEAAGRQP